MPFTYCRIRAGSAVSILANADARSAWNGVPTMNWASVRLAYSAQSSERLKPSVRRRNMSWSILHRVTPSTFPESMGNPAHESASMSRLIVRGVTSNSRASASSGTP